ncbi:Flavohemoprotein [Yarrowia sp. B02]|nr:Flavohemoprotein [Yarrowia sp. B02]
MLTDAQTKIIKDSAPFLADNGTDFAASMYKYMFATYPEVIRFFNQSDQKSLAQPKILAHALVAYASNIDNLGVLSDFVEQIVVKHVGLQIQPEQYPIVAASIVHTLKEMLGEAATPEFIDAWTVAYTQLANILIDAEKKLYAKQAALEGGWEGFRDFTVTKVEDESSNVKSVYFKSVDGKPVTTPVPGQYVTLLFTFDGQETMRSYTVSQKVTADEYRISVRKVEGGLVSSFIHSDVKPGTVLKVAPPTGRFTYTDDGKKILFVAGGIGITPLISIIEETKGKDSTLIYCDRTPETQPFGKWLDDAGVKTTNIYSAAEQKRHISKEDFAGVDLGNVNVYLLGPAPFMTSVRSLLSDLGFTGEIKTEFFGPVQV